MLQKGKIQVFQNYIQHIAYSIYQTLIATGILDGLKFPGTSVSIEVSNSFIALVKTLGCQVDNHGWNGITAQLHDLHFADNIQSFEHLSEYLNLPGASDYSSHIGASTAKLPNGFISQAHFDDILRENLSKLRKLIFEETNCEPHIYGEGLFSTYFDPRTITPTFLNHTLKSHGFESGLDGLVLDICHSSIASDYLSKKVYGMSYTFEDYLADLDLSQIFIIHCSGGYSRCCKESECDFQDNRNMDPHLISNMNDWKRLLFILAQAPNVFRVSNEIAYSGHHGALLHPKEYCLEAIMARTALETRNLDILYVVQSIVNSKLLTDCSNLEEIILEVKGFL
ncbi:MAG: hypothetical protein HFJ29_00590 [Clostridia bacterium]|nr:hypothetical protein [Clostridia bacterium]